MTGTVTRHSDTTVRCDTAHRDGKVATGRARVKSGSREGGPMPTHDSSQSRPQRQTEDVEEVQATTESDVAERHEKLTEDVDAILDEIDDVLETNAEDFVRAFVQKGGE
jgi:ubiquitin-like protein Pup